MTALLHRWKWRAAAVSRLRVKAIANICPKCRHTRWINCGWDCIDPVGVLRQTTWQCARCGWVTA